MNGTARPVWFTTLFRAEFVATALSVAASRSGFRNGHNALAARRLRTRHSGRLSGPIPRSFGMAHRRESERPSPTSIRVETATRRLTRPGHNTTIPIDLILPLRRTYALLAGYDSQFEPRLYRNTTPLRGSGFLYARRLHFRCRSGLSDPPECPARREGQFRPHQIVAESGSLYLWRSAQKQGPKNSRKRELWRKAQRNRLCAWLVLSLYYKYDRINIVMIRKRDKRKPGGKFFYLAQSFCFPAASRGDSALGLFASRGADLDRRFQGSSRAPNSGLKACLALLFALGIRAGLELRPRRPPRPCRRRWR